MKNKIFIIVILMLLTGCLNQNSEVTNKEEIIKEDESEIVQYYDDNPINIGIYENDIKLVKEYKLENYSGKEVIFSFYYTNEEDLGSRKQKENWNRFYSKYLNIDNYKIGFTFTFYIGETKISKTILKPDIYAFNPYFYIYIYDDINQPDNTFYSHLEETDVNEKTIFSSIKIYLVESFKITSPIEFTVFTYDDLSDFDENNNYRGNSRYTIKINLI